MGNWYLPEGYIERLDPAYHDDAALAVGDIVHQPEVYDVADYLRRVTGRSTIVDVGCGNAKKLRGLEAQRHVGIDFGPNISWCRSEYRDWGEWHEADLSDPLGIGLARLASDDAVVICADVIEHLPEPGSLIALLAAFHERGAIVITSTPDRIRVRGANHQGPPPNPAHVREWALAEYAALLAERGLPSVYAGYTLNNSVDRLPTTIITIHHSAVGRAREAAAATGIEQRPLAILSVFNEGDVIGEVIRDLLAQGCDVAAIDNWSTDNTWDQIQAAANCAPSRVHLERFPQDVPAAHYEWQAILRRKEEIALQHQGRWIVHTDADELRRSPFPDLTLAQALAVAQHWGANRVAFNLLNFRPIAEVENSRRPIEERLIYYEFGTRPGHFQQRKAWLQGQTRVDLSSSGGHEVQFENARDFPYKFLLKHYPIRSAEHGRRKVLTERRERWSPYEKQTLGWHTQYDDYDETSTFLWNPMNLKRWCPDIFRREDALLIMTDLVERRIAKGWSL